MTLTAEPAIAPRSTRAVLSVLEFHELLMLETYDDEVQVDGTRYRPHSNGGGLVALTAFVGDDVYVGPNARVEGNAILLDRVKLIDRAVVRGHATLADRCTMSGDSIVEDFATLTGMVTLRRHARVGGTARLEGGILLDCYARITRGQLFGPLSIE